MINDRDGLHIRMAVFTRLRIRSQLASTRCLRVSKRTLLDTTGVLTVIC